MEKKLLVAPEGLGCSHHASGPYSVPQSAVIDFMCGCLTSGPSKPCSGAMTGFDRYLIALTGSDRCDPSTGMYAGEYESVSFGEGLYSGSACEKAIFVYLNHAV